VRALAPITADTRRAGEVFASRYPEMSVTRYLVPSFENSPNLPASESHRQTERQQIHEWLPRLISQERPDILILGREAFAWYAPDIASAYALPCLLMVHGATTIGILTGTYPEDLAHQLLGQYRRVNLIVTPARHMAENLRRLGLTRVKVLPNPVDLRRFFPQPKNAALLRQLQIQADDVVVVHASNLKALKRPLDLVSSAEHALRRNPKLMYVVVGDGPCKEAMEDACQVSSVAERFRFVGEVDYASMPDYINLADIVAMPSEAETQALVYLETQACGRLMLASDIPGAREVITDGETGLLFRMGAVDDLTAKTLLAASNAQLRTDIGRKSWERVRSHALESAVSAYAATLEDVVRSCHA
jgi:glycosyltransferase involved in cell wall biosynthesis